MRKLLVAAAVLLAACSQGDAGRGAAVDSVMREEMAAASAPAFGGEAPTVAADASNAAAPSPAAPGFYMAYVYGLGLELPGNRLAGVMDAHAQACTAAGPAVCQLMQVSREGDPDIFISGSLSLRARPDWLQSFMAQAETSATEVGGEVRSRTTSAEDVTRQMVDTEARLNALRTLRDRLQEILRSRPGRLADLLEVERELARVQGELDAVTSSLAVLRQRVDMSELQIGYTMADRAVTPRTFEPISEAASGFLHTLSWGVAGIITFVATLLPWTLFLGVAVLALRALKVGRGWRWPWGRKPPAPGLPREGELSARSDD
jgi:hypothetical protein